jgi:hypothetical protein
MSDRLYELLPDFYRERDAAGGYPLRALLGLIGEQVDVVEADLEQLYDNWFIETCADWVVPYIGDLIGYRLPSPAGAPPPGSPRTRERERLLVPRRDVANTIGHRRRKGALALLELLARDVAGWPARAVEMYRLLGVTQPINHLRLERGRTVDLRSGALLELLDGPFDRLGHRPDIRRISSHRRRGLHNIPSVALFVWRLRTYSITRAPAYCLEEVGPNAYTFSELGIDTPLFARARPEDDPSAIAGEANVPAPIRRRALDARRAELYGPDASLAIWIGDDLVAADRIVSADLGAWSYRPPRGQVAVDPERGRIVFPPREPPREDVTVSYHYGSSADIGGGEYRRRLRQPEGASVYRVGRGLELTEIGAALAQWAEEDPDDAVVEIADSGVYTERLEIELREGQTLQLRAASEARPAIRLLDYRAGPDALSVCGAAGSRLTLDGLLVTGRPVRAEGDLDELVIRDCTLVPGWGLANDCEPKRPSEPSLELHDVSGDVIVERSIIGSIRVQADEVKADPVPIRVLDSVLDATDEELEALSGPSGDTAHAVATIVRTTVIGRIETHAIDLGENAILLGRVCVSRRHRGCIRYSYVTPGSHTPRRHACQPDLVEGAPPSEAERLRVRPLFKSLRYGTPTYCRLAETCAVEIVEGADDESEMGVFHDLYLPQRAENLRSRVEEHTPAGMDAGVIFVN